ncbi:MAG: serine protein kinase RIO, partial [Candidatus Lokiarchaeota archaeon]|nr:serine protein kinase RIO [Candidatus Lokiarchaeota archaeon]
MYGNFDKKIDELERKKDRNRIRIKDSEDRDAFQRVFDSRTISELEKLLNQGIIGEIIGIVSQGKEANVYFAYDLDMNPIALKIYKIDIQSAKWMKNYIRGDPRFKKIGNSPDKIIYTWCQKEYKNLKILNKVKIPAPKPLKSKANILVMSYIGENNGTPAPKLKDSTESISD